MKQFSFFSDTDFQELSKRSFFCILVILAVMLITVSSLQAGRNIFRPVEKNNSDLEQEREKPFFQSKISRDQEERVDLITKSFQQGTSSIPFSRYYIFIGVIFVLILISVFMFQKYYREYFELSLYDPQNLFKELCIAHNLSWQEQQLLQTVAKKQNLSNSLPVFIEPRYLNTCFETETSQQLRTKIRLLLEKIFDQSDNSNLSDYPQEQIHSTIYSRDNEPSESDSAVSLDPLLESSVRSRVGNSGINSSTIRSGISSSMVRSSAGNSGIRNFDNNE